MENSSSSGTSWAHQWDYSSPDPVPPTRKTSKYGLGMAAKHGKKVGVGLEKTKSVATTGFKKIKAGTSVGFHWIKDNCQKN